MKREPRSPLLDKNGNLIQQCSFDEAALIPEMSCQTASRLVQERAGLLVLKKAVIEQVLWHIEENTTWRMRERVFKLVGDAMPVNRLAFLLDTDRLYSSIRVWDRFAPSRHWRVVGSLTETLQLAGHCEKEIQIGTMRTAYKNLVDIAQQDPRVRELGLVGMFYLEAASGQGGPVHSVLEEFQKRETIEFGFWSDYVVDFRSWAKRRRRSGPTVASGIRQQRLGRFEASLDFRTVWLDGVEYGATKLQAAALKFMFEEQDSGRAEMSQDEVSNSLESPPTQLRTVFRSRLEIWNRVLDRPRKGMIRIRTT